jgi:hypothetical protein
LLGGNAYGDQNSDSLTRKPSKDATTCCVEAQVLETKLQELRAERERRLKELDLESLDEDIAALERTLKLVKPTAA